ncbi:ankyrin repeat domain-containing protein [Rhizobiaceae bacterium n13]|uniref:Ankyrin repeat domain-containing protein n=1 Tax=Ferirhizobium litorale TaxID=2927786 RepID=A0AAE3QJR0_9HYPH|nr:ankyrin repeat domain-containing protein [Fererhizobium litorale]MDI7864449.1 ankyrin repeat domain-containing protein [Fererhizobium litorale]MDI7924800.1 ankyrin repeat domain-containing protein [Fererhizobium litorale]
MNLRLICVAGVIFATSTASAGPLHDAARDGDLTRTTQLLDQGANAAEPDETGEPPLLIAALAGKKEVVALLLDRGTDVEIRNKGGLTALHAAAYGGNLEVVELLVQKGAAVNDHENFYNMSPLHAAAEEGHADVVAFLLANKAEVEAKERNGYTPLTQAGWRSHWDTAGLLLKAGAVCQEAKLVGEWLFTECTKRK